MTKGKRDSLALDKWEEILCDIPGYDPIATAGDCCFDDHAAQMALDFFPECLSHVEGALYGKPFILEHWQQAIVANIFGWKRTDGSRRYREAFIFVPRKNGKTPLAAGIANYVLFCDDEKGQQNICAAADSEQASLLYRHAKGMVENEPELNKRAKIYGGVGHRSIVIDEYNSAFKVISSDAKTKHGGNAHLIIVDELHAQESRDLVDVLETSTASQNRRQPLLIHITTSDFDRESICNEKHDYASKVRDGIIEDQAFLPVIYEAKRDDDWTSEEVWQKSNPNLGVSVSLDYLQRMCRKAQETPSFENTFKRLHLNIRTEQDIRWLQMNHWDACNAPVFLEKLKGRQCFGGLDLSSTNDITALVLLFPDDDGFYDLLPFFWVPTSNAHKRERRDRVPYQTWAKQGCIELTSGDVIDYDRIRNKVIELGKIYNIRTVNIDRWAATQITNQLTGDGFEMVPMGQGFASMTAPTKELEKLVISGKLRHGGNPVMRWMASNATVETDAAGNLKPSKKRSTEKIDGITATINALGGAIASLGDGVSIYETRGFLTL